MNAKKSAIFALTIIICIALAACGAEPGGAPAQEDIPNAFAGRWISDDDPSLAYIFDEDLVFHVQQGGSETLTGSYTYTASSATATAGDEGQASIYCELITDGTITANTGSGANVFFRRVSARDSEVKGSELGETLTVDNGNATFTTEYYDLKLRATYPETLSIADASLQYPALLLTDGSKGYFLLRDVTEYFGRFTGTPEEFITAYINDYIYPDYQVIFGAYPDYDNYNVTHPEAENRFATADIELFAGEDDIEVVIHITALRDDTGKITTLTAAAWFAPRKEKEQLQKLRTLVTDYGTTEDKKTQEPEQ